MTTRSATRTAVQVSGLSKSFPNRSGIVDALRDVTFSVAEGEFFSIVGPSGCGKSTLLNVVAGLELEDRGRIVLGSTVSESYYDPEEGTGQRSETRATRTDQSPIEGRPTRYQNAGEHDPVLPAENRNTSHHIIDDRLGRSAYMPQKDLLLPWRTVLDNASLGLELMGLSRAEARRRASALLSRFGLDGFADNYPATLSGGMRQRTAFLRTILPERELLLLDEPFGALDALTRRSMQAWLLDVWSEMRHTVLLITHDVEEAVFLSDRVAVMSRRPGSIIYEREVELPRPRAAEIVTDPAFVDIKRDVLLALQAAMEDGPDVPE